MLHVVSVEFILSMGENLAPSYNLSDFRQISRTIISTIGPDAVSDSVTGKQAKIYRIENDMFLERTMVVGEHNEIVAEDALPSVIEIGPYPYTLDAAAGLYEDPSGLIGGEHNA